MKHTLLLLVTFACCTNDTIGQPTTWADTSSVWYYNDPPSDFTLDPRSVFYRMSHQGDTILDGVQCVILGDSITHEYMYQEDGKVYYWQSDQFHKVYDFTAEQGDTIMLEYRAIVGMMDTIIEVFGVVESTYQILAGTEQLDRFEISILPDTAFPLVWPTVVYTERIGSETEMIEVLIQPTFSDLPLLRCFEDSQIEYTSEWWEMEEKPCDFQIISGIEQMFSDSLVTVFPNPVKDRLTIRLQERRANAMVRIATIAGEDVLKSKFTGEAVLNLRDFLQGVYILSVSQPSQSTTIKLIVL